MCILITRGIERMRIVFWLLFTVILFAYGSKDHMAMKVRRGIDSEEFKGKVILKRARCFVKYFDKKYRL